MPDLLPYIKPIIEHRWEISSPLFILSAALLFLPAGVLAIVGADEFASTYRTWIGLVFLASVALLLEGLVRHLIERRRRSREGSEARQKLEQLFKRMGRDELALLGRFVSQERQTLDLPAFDSLIQGMVARGVLIPHGGLTRLDPNSEQTVLLLPHSIPDDIWDYLQEQDRARRDTEAKHTGQEPPK